MSQKRVIAKLSKNLLLLAAITFLVTTLSTLLPGFLPSTNQQTGNISDPQNEDVLGYNSYYQEPRIYIYAGQSQYSSGGLISLASTDEPAIFIDGYQITEDATIDLYKADINAALTYLTHDDKGNQIKKDPDTSEFDYITQVKTAVNTGSGTKVTLPLTESGIWYLKVQVNGVISHAFVTRSETGTLLKEGNNEFIFWAQQFKTRKSVSDGVVTTYNLQDSAKVLSTSSFNAEGITKMPLSDLADIAVVKRNDDLAIIPINLTYLNTSYSYKNFTKKPNVTRYFVFTDRPLYQPGDTVYFKAVLRDDDDARYSTSEGAVTVKVTHEYDQKEPDFEKSYTISTDGTISGEYKIPKDGEAGSYSLSLSRPGESTQSNYYSYYYESDTSSSEYAASGTSFEVEFFRKPEFFLDVTTEKTHLIAGDTGSFTITGQYFSGQPLANQTIKYDVGTSNYYEYDYLSSRKYEESSFESEHRYRNWYGQTDVTTATVTLDENGQAVIPFETTVKEDEGKHQIYNISATLEDGSQDPSFASRNVLVSAGEYSIYRDDYGWGTEVGKPFTLPLTLIANKENAKITEVNLSAKVHREEWIWYQEPDKKYPSYRKEEEDLPEIKVKTDKNGKVKVTYIPKKKGSYTIEVSGQDSKGNTIKKTFYSYASEENEPYYYSANQSSISIISDKKEYEPGDVAKLTISSEIPDRDIFLTFERGRTDRYEIVHMIGKTAELNTSVGNSDMPNMYTVASSFSQYGLDTNGTNLIVSPLEKKLSVQIVPDRTKYGPSDTVNVNISTTDTKGNAQSAEVALWAVDKAIFELSDNKLGNIFKTFWNQRINSTLDAHSLQGILVYNAEQGGGCFAKGTKILMADGTSKNIEQVQIGDYVATRNAINDTLVRAKVTSTKMASENSYIILNGKLHVTADHIIRINDTWQEAGSAQVGDYLINSEGKQEPITSVEWLLGKTDVYNLEIEKEHTFIAEGIWVHNQKGLIRNTFKDTAYWNPTIRTDASGRAKVSFKLPDNLTTWAFAAVASTQDTKVGQSTTEIIVSKDIIVRPIVPKILRVGDEAVLSALVQNFTENTMTLATNLTFNAGKTTNPSDTEVTLKSKETKRVFWTVTPETENEKAEFKFEALNKNNSKQGDIVNTVLPVRAFGFEEKQVESGVGNKTYTLIKHSDSDPEKSSIVLSLASTMLGTLPTAMEYLIQYPYGCIEQTTSRFVPAVIAKANTSLFSNALRDKNLDDIIEKGIKRLAELQQPDGGWGWWSSQRSNTFITAYVLEYLLEAKKQGYAVDNVIDEATRYFEDENNWYTNPVPPPEALIARTYALALLDSDKRISFPVEIASEFTPDILALSVITNYLNGNKNPDTNGLNILQSRATRQEDGAFWAEGNSENFGSKDASTALAIRAILIAKGDRDLASEGARYLVRNRKHDYWSNTFATAQVIRALTELGTTGAELTPQYTYTAALDGKQIVKAEVTNKLERELIVPDKDIKDGSQLSLTKEGEGQLYSTLVSKQWRTDKDASSVEHGLKITREYINEKGYEYSLGLGDSVQVELTVSGLESPGDYAVIEDQLPAGLVPINENFKNEGYGQPNQYQWGVSDREITENGMILSLYRIEPGVHTYSYRARVVSSGTFLVPPAFTTLMYSPEIYGRTEVQTVQIDNEAKVIPGRIGKKAVADLANNKTASTTGIIIILILAALTILNRKRPDLFVRAKERIQLFIQQFKKPPTPPDATPPGDMVNP